MRRTNSQTLGILLLVVSIVLYASSYILLKKAINAGTPGLHAIFFGNIIQQIIILSLCIYLQKLKFPTGTFSKFLILALFGGATSFFAQLGVSLSNPGNCTLIQSCLPFIAAPAGFFILRETVPWYFFIFALVAIGGIYLVVGLHQSTEEELYGYLAIVVSLCCNVLWLLYQRFNKLEAFLSALLARFVGMMFAIAPIIISGSHESLLNTNKLSFFYIALFSLTTAAGAIIVTQAVSMVHVSTSSMMSLFLTCCTYLFQAIFLKFDMTFKQFIGIVITLTSMSAYLVLLNRDRYTSAPELEETLIQKSP